MQRICYIIFFAAFVALVPSCFKENSFEKGVSTTGKGSLQKNANSDCLPKIITGVYEAGTTLTAASFLSVDVDVTAAGSYIIESNAVNGYVFKASGTFTNTGIQTIKLIAIGKPLAAGTDRFEISFDGTSCFIEVAVLPNGSGGPAIFTLQGAGGACTNAIISGSYVVSTPLNTSNTISLTVNVTKIGTYSITTTAANGITFSGSGIFTSTGAKTIVLTGSGSPATNSATTVTVTAGGGNCTFVVPVSAPAALTIDCSTAVVAGTYITGTALGAGNTVTISVNVITPGAYSISTSPVNGIVFAGSGSLAAGAQTIKLTATGTPTTAGNFTIAVSFSSSTCSFPLVVSGATVTGWNFTQGATTTYLGVEDQAQMNTVASINVFNFSGSNATDDIIIALTDLSGGIQADEVYSTNSLSNNSAAFLFVGATDTYKADNTTASVNLIFKVTVHNAVTKTIQGVFNGNVVDANNVSKQITNGQFWGIYQ